MKSTQFSLDRFNVIVLDFVDTIDSRETPESMMQAPGMQFCDPRIDTDVSFVPGGYKLTTLIVSLQEVNGIVGWQCIWRAGESHGNHPADLIHILLDGAPDIQGLKRGKWSGAGLSTQEINFPLDDFIKGLEYYYEGVVIYGIRFGWHFHSYCIFTHSPCRAIFFRLDCMGRRQK